MNRVLHCFCLRDSGLCVGEDEITFLLYTAGHFVDV